MVIVCGFLLLSFKRYHERDYVHLMKVLNLKLYCLVLVRQEESNRLYSRSASVQVIVESY